MSIQPINASKTVIQNTVRQTDSDVKMEVARETIESNGRFLTKKRIYGDMILNNKKPILILGIYQGEMKRGIAEGFGTFDMGSEGTYIGRYENGLRHGLGMYYFMGGVFFQKWANGMLLENGIYSGEVKEGMPNGSGVLNWMGVCEMYSGSFENGVYHGLGILMNSQGFYMGRFENGIAKGFGSFTSNDQAAHFGGLWDHNLPNGYGKLQLADGSQYQGEWINGELHTEDVHINYLGVKLIDRTDEKELEEINAYLS